MKPAVSLLLVLALSASGVAAQNSSPPATPAILEALKAVNICQKASGPDSGHIYSARSTDIPPVLSSALTNQKTDLAIRVCSDLNYDAHYFLRVAQPKQSGMCWISEEEIFPSYDPSEYVIPIMPRLNDEPKLMGWTRQVPFRWSEILYSKVYSSLAHTQIVTITASVSGHLDGPCPLSDDPGYFPVKMPVRY